MHHPTDRITHTKAFVTPIVEHWPEQEIAQLVHHYLIRDGELDCGDDGTSGEGRWVVEVLSQVGQQVGGVDEGQLAETLGHHVPRAFLRALAVIK